MVIDLTNRALLDTAADRGRFIARPADAAALTRALALRFNVLLVAERGAGASSLLAQLPRLAGDALPPVRIVRAGRVDSPAALLALAARALAADAAAGDADDMGAPRERVAPAPARTTDEDGALHALETAAVAHGAAILVLDGVQSGGLVHGVFGRMRDELWQLGDLRWVVAIPAGEEAAALTPPADQFFETVHRLAPFDEDAIVALLRGRDPDGALDAAALREAARVSRGNASAALRAARALVGGAARVNGAQDVVAEIEARLGEPAARLAAALSQAGSSGPSDDALLAQLGWSRPRTYEVFRLLDEHGYLVSSQERNGRPGRPRKVFRLDESAA